MISQSVTITGGSYSNDTDAVFESQTPAGLVVDIDGVLPALADGTAQRMLIQCDGDNTGISFIVVGLDADGLERTETVAGVNTTNTSTQTFFNTIQSITLTGTTATAIFGGWDFATLGVCSASIPTDTGKNPYAFTAYLATDRALENNTYYIQYTYDDLWDMSVTPVWVNSTHTGQDSLVFEETVVAPFMRIYMAADANTPYYTLNFYQAG